MPTTWDAICLGQAASLDPTENNTVAENAGDLSARPMARAGGPLPDSTNDREGTAGVLDQNDRGSNDRITYDIGNGSQAVNFDAAVQYDATLTYPDGSTWTGTLVVIQDTSGNLFLAPPLTAGPEFDALQADAIGSLIINGVVGDSFSGLGQDRPPPTFLTCFATGTLIRTATGDSAIETLQPGDLVVTLEDGVQPLRWIGA